MQIIACAEQKIALYFLVCLIKANINKYTKIMPINQIKEKGATMYHVRTVLEDSWQKRKEDLGESITLEMVFKKGIEAYEKEQTKKRVKNDSQN